jgi:propionate catabolism operon transcriptional regulator
VAFSDNSKARILIFGHKEFSQLLSSVLGEFAKQAECRIVDAIIGTIDEATAHVSVFNPDVVISAGSNAAYLQVALDVPVLSIDVTESDIVSAVLKAAKVSNKIHLITYDNYTRLVDLLNQTSSLHITHSYYETAKEAKQTYHLSKITDSDVVVGASLVCDLASQDNIKSFLIYSKESCRNLLQEAVTLADEQKQSVNSQAMQKWLNYGSKTPILMVDNQTNFMNTNSAAKEQFSITQNNQAEIIDILSSNQFDHSNDGQCRVNNKDWWFHKDSIDLANHQFDVYQFYAQTPDIIKHKPQNPTLSPLVYNTQSMQSLVERVDLYAQSPSHVLVIGESGTGKEMIARRIHQQGLYAAGQFVAINCAAMPSELFEGELFGYVEGSFTGAKRGGKHGLLYEANEGVLFLDEVGELSLPQQAKLLRVIQEKSYRPIGSLKEFNTNLKIIAATNKPLVKLVEDGLFREDLFYRLNVLSINVPSLRERAEDIASITQAKLQELNFGQLDQQQLNQLHKQLLPVFSAYHWPGNIRELENIVERILVYCCATTAIQDNAISSLLTQLAPELFQAPMQSQTGTLVENEVQLVSQAMTKFSGNKQLAAKYLGISQTTLWRRLKKINENNQRGHKHA